MRVVHGTVDPGRLVDTAEHLEALHGEGVVVGDVHAVDRPAVAGAFLDHGAVLTGGGEGDAEAVAGEVGHTRTVVVGSRDWLVGDDELWPGHVLALGVIGDIESDLAAATGEVERLARIHSQDGKSAIVSDRFDEPTIADLDVTRLADGDGSAAAIQLSGRPRVLVALRRVVRAGGAGNAPHDAVQITRASIAGRG
jgi:hypothetical protein